MTTKKCLCGEKLPYRRAYSCRKCWDKVTQYTKDALARARMTSHDGAGNLSLRGAFDKRRTTQYTRKNNMLACPECGSIAIKDIEDYLEGNLLEGDLLECEDCGEIFDMMDMNWWIDDDL